MKLYKRICLILVAFVLFFSTIFSNDIAHSQVVQNRPFVRMNRSVLTVGRDVFTALDAIAILVFWNLSSSKQEKEIRIETKWLGGFVLQELVKPDAETMKLVWPEDVRTFFQLALVWVDIKKLNLFVASDREINSLAQKISEQNRDLLSGIEPALVEQLLKSPEKLKKEWAELVIRARIFYRVRGSFERNKSLFNSGWYWHEAGLDSAKK